MQSIVISVSGCFVCLSTRISSKPHVHPSWNFLLMLPAAVAWFFSDNSAICYVLLVLWMMSRFHIIGNMWCTSRLTAEGCQSAGGNAERAEVQCFSSPSLCCLPLLLNGLTIHDGVWLRRRTVSCARGQSLLVLSSIGLLQMHHEEFDVKAALHELYGLSLKYYDDVCDDMLWPLYSNSWISVFTFVSDTKYLLATRLWIMGPMPCSISFMFW